MSVARVARMGEETAVPMGLAMIASIVLAALAFVTLTRKNVTQRNVAGLDHEPATAV